MLGRISFPIEPSTPIIIDLFEILFPIGHASHSPNRNFKAWARSLALKKTQDYYILTTASSQLFSQGTFSNLTNLEILKSRVERNKISSICSSGVLDLGHNSLTQIEENTFFDLKSLIDLKLNNNGLRKIADGAFDELQLANLELDYNKLEDIPLFKKPSHIASCTDISYNPVKKIDAETLGKHYELESLHMKKTDIRELQNGIFINNTKLQILSFQNCSKLKDIKQNAFKGTRLQALDLQNTPIDSLPGADLESLRKLFIKGATELWEIPIISFKSSDHGQPQLPISLLPY
ncbi:otolith morphogenesis [Desmophyllum pertusum]|uniref:Otolith morphogenesis n=1 Tax=Desmophyllum pertusum TaxID=174260 RepID=A0A9W9ZJA1_9CNID|nr:otolith morphogenesis [Desmophyllum pertusum]